MKTLLLAALFWLHPIASQYTGVRSSMTTNGPGPGPGPLTGATATQTRTRIYVLGGQSVQASDASPGTISTGFYSLDLTKSWTSEAPIWYRHANGPTLWRSSICSSVDGSRIVAFSNGGGGGYYNNSSSGESTAATTALAAGAGGISVYSTAKNAWYPIPGAGESATNSHHLTEVRCVTSREDGRVYISGGLGDTQAMTMDVFSFESESLTTIDMPRLVEYMPKDNSWKDSLQNTAEGPKSLIDHCMATDEEGTKVFIYGGRSQWNGQAEDTFYIYDVGRQTWKQGPSIGRRIYASCAVVGDYFLLFGGTEDPFTDIPVDMGKAGLTVNIFKISANIWVNDFVPGSGSTSSVRGGPPSSTSSGHGVGMPGMDDDSGIQISSNVGLIVGAIGAGIIIVGLMVTLYFYLRSRDKRRVKQ
ncbi:hypothetical protein BGW42_000206 [Actinomortierella wolfii]|nr:hypothetical protein BGW42_000206 [Actinomortierella wolfii]